jgi:hypothetical protein
MSMTNKKLIWISTINMCWVKDCHPTFDAFLDKIGFSQYW